MQMACSQRVLEVNSAALMSPAGWIMEFITKVVDKGAVERLKMVVSTPFERCTYTRAIELLEEAVKGGKKFEFPVRSCMRQLAKTNSLQDQKHLDEAQPRFPLYSEGVQGTVQRSNCMC